MAAKSKLKMHGNRKQLPVSAKRPKAISGCMATGNSIQKAAIAADEITNKVPRTPFSSIFICNPVFDTFKKVKVLQVA